MTFECTLTQTLSYRAMLEAPTQAHAEQAMRVLVADAEIKPETVETECDAYCEMYCDDCGESHIGPVCQTRKPVQSEILIAPSWERAKL